MILARKIDNPPKPKGARHCCQAPCRRTAAVDPDGSSAWFRRLPWSAPARACEPWVGRRGWPLSAHPEGELRLPASAARFVLPAGGRNSEAVVDTIFSVRSLLEPSAPLALRIEPIRHLRRAAPSLPDPGACAPFAASQGFVPFPPLPSALSHACASPFGFRFGPRLRAAFPLSCRPPLARRAPLLLRTALACRTPLPVEPCPVVPRNFRSAWAALPLRNYQDFRIPEPFAMRFPEGTCTVSGPCKLLILLWFPAVRPSRLQI
jgi:hypothetical protein